MKDDNAERHRYFRINDSVKLSYQILHQPGVKNSQESFDLMAEQNRRMDALIAEQKHQYPEIIELIALLNQKIENLCLVDKTGQTTLAHHARNVNISACGLAFSEQEPTPVGTQLQLFLVLDNNKKLELEGLVVGCHLTSDSPHRSYPKASRSYPKASTTNTLKSSDNNNDYTWRVDFLHLSTHNEELLIQHIVRRQSTLLAEQRQQVQLGENYNPER